MLLQEAMQAHNVHEALIASVFETSKQHAFDVCHAPSAYSSLEAGPSVCFGR